MSDGQGRVWSWSEWSVRVLRTAGGLVQLADSSSSGRGGMFRFVLDARRSVDGVLLVTALLEAGIPFALLHPRWSEGQRRKNIARLGDPSALGPEMVPSLEAAGRGAPALQAVTDDERPAVAVFTSGTSGDPKAAVLSRRALAASAIASEENLGWQEGDRWLLSMPLAHVGGLSVVTRCAAAGRCVVIDPSDRFSPDALLRACESEQVTLLSVVPTMLHRLLEHQPQWAIGNLRAVLVGGDATPAALAERAIARGIPILLTYGMSETCSQVATQCSDRLTDVNRGRDVGRPLRGTEVRLSEGRIEVRGDTLFSGYFELSSGSHALSDGPSPSGWFRTSDIGRLDADGRLLIRGRADDVIVSGGENVLPLTVEESLRASPGVADACVVGLPDEEWGEIVAAVCVLFPGATPEAVLAECRRRLASFEVPRSLVACVSLPTNAQGKVDRKACQALVLDANRAGGP